MKVKSLKDGLVTPFGTYKKGASIDIKEITVGGEKLTADEYAGRAAKAGFVELPTKKDK